ncbi:MAG: choline dehydrogenase, partial [Alphaproteobacteria bacterium]|nr:choline dehydrogenase [Alphaproteobacteria bacterium]
QFDNYDYVIVGAGSAGCVLANRLSADPDVRVLLLEAGGKDNNIWIKIPAGFTKTMDMPEVNWLFDSVPEESSGNRPIPIPRGRVLGGSSSINGMLYVRGQHRDYDGWAQLGNRGWSYDDVLPYFKKAENREGDGADSDYHGVGGPLNVADLRETHGLLDAVIDAAETAGYPRNPDYNGAEQDGFGYYQVTQKGGRRFSAADAYLHPARGRPNLTVETDAHTKRVLFDGRRAAGVAYDRHGSEHEVKAAKEVILCAGAVQSPQLLELSGVGRPELLQEHGIEVVHALPGVGENYQDHYVTRMATLINQPITLNQTTRGLSLVAGVLKYAIAHKGDLTFPAGIVFGFVRTRPELESPDVQYHIAHASYKDAKRRIFDREPGLTISPCQLRPESRGTIHIGSSDPYAAPLIRPNFLTTKTDQDTLVAGMRIARTLTAAEPLSGFCVSEVRPGADVDGDDELLDYARHNGGTIYHPVGTCKMGSDTMAVVDDHLSVHGLEGLRVVDASIMPTLTSGNTHAPTVMIAEKAADMIKAAAG